MHVNMIINAPAVYVINKNDVILSPLSTGQVTNYLRCKIRNGHG